MATNKQTKANQNNALLSTGPKSDEGKSIVSKNAIKHGIFTRDLIISKGDGKEDEKEYRELLGNLIDNLNPQGQLESLLVEKIAVDFWRLRRLLRFETGSIRKFLDNVVANYYEESDWHGNKINMADSELDEEVTQCRESIDWNVRYMKCLRKGKVSFDEATWEGEGLESDIEEDLLTVIEDEEEGILTDDEKARLEQCAINFEETKQILKRAGYTNADITKKLIGCLEAQNSEHEETIRDLERSKIDNRNVIEARIQESSLPSPDNTERVIRYEKAIQRSIFQNLAVLKKLQSLA
jgi:hypothetical protein